MIWTLHEDDMLWTMNGHDKEVGPESARTWLTVLKSITCR
jgi:hypothetical protein